MSLPSLVEVMRGETVTLDCRPVGTQDHFVLEWFLVSVLPSGQGKGRGPEVGTLRSCPLPPTPSIKPCKAAEVFSSGVIET